MEARRLEITYPDWLVDGPWSSREFPSDDEKIDLAIQLSKTSVERGGGPFGSAVFDGASGAVIAVGANQVVANGNSVLHAEIMAIMQAEHRVGSHWLAQGKERPQGVVLASSCEPCCMCLGAIVASGIERVLCAATGDDARAVGFDEGPVFEESWTYLERRGIRVLRGLHRARANEVLAAYKSAGGPMYIPDRLEPD